MCNLNSSCTSVIVKKLVLFRCMLIDADSMSGGNAFERVYFSKENKKLDTQK